MDHATSHHGDTEQDRYDDDMHEGRDPSPTNSQFFFGAEPPNQRDEHEKSGAKHDDGGNCGVFCPAKHTLRYHAESVEGLVQGRNKRQTRT